MSNKLKEAEKREKEMNKKMKEFEEKIKELEAENKGKKRKEEKKDKGPKLFGANEDALIDALYGPPIPMAKGAQNIPQANTQVDQFGHADIPPAKSRKEDEIRPAQKIQSSAEKVVNNQSSITGPLFGNQEGIDQFGHADIPPARHLNSSNQNIEDSKKVTFNENLNMHENSSESSLGDEDVQPIKAQPFLFGNGDNDDMDEMKFPSDGHLQKQINI